MFNENEHICVSNSQFAYLALPRSSILSQNVPLVSNNPSIPIKHVDSSDLILMAINPIKEALNRQDSNVSAYRSFLIELDMGDIKTQLGTIRHFGIPFSAQVFSGGKSVHTVVTLSEDLPDEKTYRFIGKWIFNIISMADSACSNPSRSVRIPGAYREPKKKQRLISLGERIKLKDFMGWLNKYPHLRPKAKIKKTPILTGQPNYSKLSPWARSMMTKGVSFDNRGRNQTWFGLAYDLALAGFSEDQGIELLSQRFVEEDDFKEKEFLTTVKSAFKKVSEGK